MTAIRNARTGEALQVAEAWLARNEGRPFPDPMTEQELAAAGVIVCALKPAPVPGSPFGPGPAEAWAARFRVTASGTEEAGPSVTGSGRHSQVTTHTRNGTCVTDDGYPHENMPPAVTCAGCGTATTGPVDIGGGARPGPRCETCRLSRKFPNWSFITCWRCGRTVYYCGPWPGRYCTAECRRAVRQQRRRQRPATADCASCGQPYTPSRSDAAYCSPACRQRAYRQRSAS
jgi:hypothetical protein